MDDVSKLMRRHTYVTKTSTSLIYAILVSIAVNFFLDPGAYLFFWDNWVCAIIKHNFFAGFPNHHFNWIRPISTERTVIFPRMAGNW